MKVRAICYAAALVVTLSTVATADNIHVRVNGDPVYFEGPKPYTMNGRIMVPLRGVFEHLGATVEWLPYENTVIATRGDMEIRLPIGSDTATVDGAQMKLDAPASIVAGHTMVPLRFLSQTLGATVAWAEDENTVNIQAPSTFAAYRPSEDGGTSGEHYAFIPEGTVLTVRVESQLSSASSAAGDRFSCTVMSDGNATGLPSGAVIDGVVREAIPARNGRPGLLDVSFNRIDLQSGRSEPIEASLISLDGKHVTRDSGRMVAKADHRHDQMKWVGIGAGAGLLISAVAGGDALLNTILGAGSGYLFNEFQRKRASNVVIRDGSRIGVRLDQDLRIRTDPR